MSLPAVSDAPPPPRAHAQGAATDAVHAALDFFGVPDAAYIYEARQPEPPPRARAQLRAEKHQTGSRVLLLEGGGACGFRALALALPVPAFLFPVPFFRFPDRYDGR